MKGRRSYQPSGFQGTSQEYAKVFILRVHELIAFGYARLSPRDHASRQEEEITGCLAQAIDDALGEPDGPEWFTYYGVHEEPRVNARGRRGKRRLRLDIRIDSSELRPRSRFPFEAKRLGRGHSAGAYLGSDGLGCFVSGNYGRDGRLGGMLGYVQTGRPADWAAKIGKAMAPTRARSLHVRPGKGWRMESIVPELDHTYASEHDRPTVGSPITIYHTLLSFG